MYPAKPGYEGTCRPFRGPKGVEGCTRRLAENQIAPKLRFCRSQAVLQSDELPPHNARG